METSSNSLRLVVDGTRCDGHGICALILPDLISLDAWGYAAIEDSRVDGRANVARARRAVRACPVDALTLSGASPDGNVRINGRRPGVKDAS